VIRRPASLGAVPRCVAGFPRFVGTIRALRLPAVRPAALRFLRLAVPSLRSPSSLPPALRTRGRRAWARWGSASPCAPRVICDGDDGISQVPGGTPIAPSPGSSTPAGPSASNLPRRRRRGPRGGDVEGSCIAAFEAQSPGFGARCLRFAPAVARQGRKTRFRLLVRLCRAGSLRRVPMRSFKDASYISSSSPKLAWRNAAFGAAVGGGAEIIPAR
jgi:hypothetical protein